MTGPKVIAILSLKSLSRHDCTNVQNSCQQSNCGDGLYSSKCYTNTLSYDKTDIYDGGTFTRYQSLGCAAFPHFHRKDIRH
jgi:hypothetical protein